MHVAMSVVVHAEEHIDRSHSWIWPEGYEAWFGSIDQLGPWWAMRDQIKVDVSATDSLRASVILDPKWPIKGISIEVPEGWQLLEASGVQARQNGQRVVVSTLPGRTVLQFTRP